MTFSHPDSTDRAIERELRAVYGLYAALVRDLTPESCATSGLGGRLLFAGELNTEGCRLVRAANIAGAATLAATADRATQRAALREGVIDFLVTTLDEALRILKNEVRKRQTIAVAVEAAPEVVVEQMLERGVLPDLLPPAAFACPQCGALVEQGARHVKKAARDAEEALFTLRIPEAFARQTGALDALLLDALDTEDAVNRRWVRLAPRYLGRAARGYRSQACGPLAFRELMAKIGGGEGPEVVSLRG